MHHRNPKYDGLFFCRQFEKSKLTKIKFEIFCFSSSIPLILFVLEPYWNMKYVVIFGYCLGLELIVKILIFCNSRFAVGPRTARNFDEQSRPICLHWGCFTPISIKHQPDTDINCYDWCGNSDVSALLTGKSSPWLQYQLKRQLYKMSAELRRCTALL